MARVYSRLDFVDVHLICFQWKVVQFGFEIFSNECLETSSKFFKEIESIQKTFYYKQIRRASTQSTKSLSWTDYYPTLLDTFQCSLWMPSWNRYSKLSKSAFLKRLLNLRIFQKSSQIGLMLFCESKMIYTL